MKKIIRYQIISGVLVALFVLTLSGMGEVAADNGQSGNRLIAHTTSRLDKILFRIQGCEIINELNDATAISCPQNVRISNAEPDEILYILDLSADQQIKADQVWANGNTGAGVNIAVLDTGIDTANPELVSSIIGGKSFVSYTPNYGDDNGHGTHVSGIITADGVVDANSKGAAPDAGIWMGKVCSGSGSCYTSDIASAIQYVVNNGIAKVMSISLGGGGTTGSNCDSDYLASQVNWAYDNGVLAVVAAGNSGNARVSSPACASRAVAVAAVDSADNLAYFSSRGNALKDHGVAAPGVNIYSTIPGGYASWSGTSMATPHVSAVAALMLSENPNLSLADMKSAIFSSADCLGNKYGACPNTYIGYGRVDARSAVLAVSSPSPAPTTTTPSLSVSANPSAITVAETSAITVLTSDNRSGVAISLFTDLGVLSATNCVSDATGKCSVGFNSPTTGTATITASASGYNSGMTAVTITPEIINLAVSVAPDQSSYKRSQTPYAYITVSVSANGSPVFGAQVALTVTDPRGAATKINGVTDASGQAVLRYGIRRSSSLGTYTAQAQASAPGFNSGSGSATFVVVK
jgi:minor extracellular protease Epr